MSKVYEEDILKLWEDRDIFNKLNKKNKGNELFNGVEGPPFPTGEVHVGHLRNWALKDSVFRLKRLQGFDVYYKDGYDVNGLPVESKVQEKLNLKTVDDIKKFGEDNFVSECKKYVSEIIGDMKEVRRRYGLWLDSNHYQTSHNDYLSFAWKFFKYAQEKGLLYKGYKTVAWSPGAETTLSDYEIKDEYTVLEDPSIYVKFPLRKEDTTTGYDESLLIWTTTPWTLQSNMAIAMHPEFNYAKVLVEVGTKKEVYIIAEALVEKVLTEFQKSLDIKFKSVLEVKKGIEFEGIKYNHILLEETPSQQDFSKLDHKHVHSVVMADFVTLGEGEDVLEKLQKKGSKHSIHEELGVEKKEENTDVSSKKDGTGLVHIAPGHGFDDYEIGMKYNIPIFSPVDSKAIITEGKFEGKYFKDADSEVISYLKEKGTLLHSTNKKHKYPLCWRTKVPIVYRAVEQWWIKRSEIVEKIVKENSNVKWFPAFAQSNFNNLMLNAGDWAISRQRFWGIPLPIFEDEDGNYEVFGSKEELESKLGKKVNDIHRGELKNFEYVNEKSGKVMKAVPFIGDVWFDSGCVSFASHYGEGLSFEQIIKKYYPIKFIVEGRDQLRGWFSSLFNVGYVVTGKAPYNQVLYYEFVMAKDGTKMSKSKGNGVTGNEAIETWGADRTRYYLLTKRAPEDQINFDEGDFALVDGFFNTLDNVQKFCNSYLKEYSQSSFPTLNVQAISVEDKWILYKLNLTIQSFRRNFDHYRVHDAFKLVEDFVVRDFSKVYLKLVRDRCEARDENLLILLDKILKDVYLMLSSAIPFKCEDLYQKTQLSLKKESLYLENFPEVDEYVLKTVEKSGINENFDLAMDIVQSVLNAREKAKVGVRWPLGQIDILSSKDYSKDLEVFEPLICKLCNVVKVSYDPKDCEITYNVKPNFANLKGDFENPSLAIKVINMNKEKISDLIVSGKKSFDCEGLSLDLEKHVLKEVQLSGEVISSDFSNGSIILHTHQDEILLEQGYLREVIRRIQDLRKSLNLDKKENVELNYSGSDKYFVDLLDSSKNTLKTKVGAIKITNENIGEMQEFEIKEKKLIISLNKL